MPNSVFNWTFYDVLRVLKDHGFSLDHIVGSHHYYVGTINGTYRQVSVAFHGVRPLKPRTFKSIVCQSGIPLEEWL